MMPMVFLTIVAAVAEAMRRRKSVAEEKRLPTKSRQPFFQETAELQRRFDLKSPGFQKRLRDVFRVFVAPRPFTQAGGTNVLIRSEFELLHCLFEGCNDWNNRSDGLRFAPVRITASLCHN